MLRRNYLEVFPYDNWTSHELPPFEEGEEFMPTVCELRDGETKRPSLLTEADLVGLMDKNGIGETDSISIYPVSSLTFLPRYRRNNCTAHKYHSGT